MLNSRTHPLRAGSGVKCLCYFGHPAQFLFLRQSIQDLLSAGHKIEVVIKTKDVLENLVKASGLPYTNLLPEGRSESRSGLLLGLVKRDVRLLRRTAGKGFGLMVGSDPSLAHVGKLLGIPVFTTLEDDINVIPLLARTTYPFTRHIVTPNVCRVGPYEHKKIGYDGYMKLGYLHPNVFKPDAGRVPSHVKPPYFVIRLAQLTAHHDSGVFGLSTDLIQQILHKISNRGEVFIVAEYDLPSALAPFHLELTPSDLHHLLAFADLLISDSQSMSLEAAMLGVPSVRYSSFAGRISVLEELEHQYGLTYGVKPGDFARLFSVIDEILSTPDREAIYKQRRRHMLSEKIDVSAFMTWLIGEYPESVHALRSDPARVQEFA